MKRIFGLLVLVAACAAAHAGRGEWTSAGIHGGTVWRVEYVREGVALAITNAGVYRTTNHGATWVRVRESGPPDLSGIAVNRANPDQVLINAGFVMRSLDAGASFAPFSLGGVFGSGAKNVGFSRDGAIAWVIDPEGAVWRSTDALGTWTRLGSALPASYYWWIEPDVADRNTVYAGPGMGISISRNAGDSWTALPAAASLYSPAPSRTTAGTVLAMDTSAGYSLARSVDFGATWIAPPAGPANVFRIATGPNARAVATEYDAMVHTSSDDGLTWSNRGRLPNGEAGWLAIDPASPDHILAATAAGIAGSSDGGATWEERNQGIAEARVFDVAVARDGSNAVYVASADLSSIYRRDPASGAFTGVGHASTPLLGYPGLQRFVRDYDIEVSPQDGRTLYMLRDGHYGRSTDGGVTWMLLSDTDAMTALTLDPVNPLVAYATGTSGSVKTVDGGITWTPMAGLPAASRFLVDPTNNAVVYAGVNDFYGAAPVYKSLNGGVSWVPTGLTGSSDFDPTSLAFEPGRTSTIYMTMHTGMYKSTDSAATWARLSPVTGFPLAGFYEVVVDPQSPLIVYASSFGGVWRSVDGGHTWGEIVAPAAQGGSYGLERIVLLPGHNARLLGFRPEGGVYEAEVGVSLGLGATPSSVTAGEASMITLTARNTGTLTATRVRVTSTLPAASGAYSIQATGATCAVDTRQLSCDVGTLAGAGTATVSVGLTPITAGPVNFSLTSYESPAIGTGVQAIVTVSSAASGSSGGGGGGGRIDYLLLAFLALIFLRTPPLRRHFPSCA